MRDTPEVRAAVDALVAFLTAMRDGDHATAESLYGGSHEALIECYGQLDYLALLESACTTSCAASSPCGGSPGGLEIPEGWESWVEFRDPDGQPWSLGPCCGSNTDRTASQFTFVVAPNPSGPRVLTLPVYTP
jgi:hypothetical protein